MATTRASKRRRLNGNELKGKEEDKQVEQIMETGTGKTIEKLSTGENKGKSPLVVFAHGAGAPSSSDWMVRLVPFSLHVYVRSYIDLHILMIMLSFI